MSKKIVEKLPARFIGKGEVKGFLFKRVYSNDTHYIYKVKAGKFIYYEVFKKQVTPVCIDFKKRVYSDTHFKEVYPKANSFGFTAWTTYTLRDALKHIDFNRFLPKKEQEKEQENDDRKNAKIEENA